MTTARATTQETTTVGTATTATTTGTTTGATTMVATTDAGTTTARTTTRTTTTAAATADPRLLARWPVPGQRATPCVRWPWVKVGRVPGLVHAPVSSLEGKNCRNRGSA